MSVEQRIKTILLNSQKERLGLTGKRVKKSGVHKYQEPIISPDYKSGDNEEYAEMQRQQLLHNAEIEESDAVDEELLPDNVIPPLVQDRLEEDQDEHFDSEDDQTESIVEEADKEGGWLVGGKKKMGRPKGSKNKPKGGKVNDNFINAFSAGKIDKDTAYNYNQGTERYANTPNPIKKSEILNEGGKMLSGLAEYQRILKQVKQMYPGFTHKEAQQIAKEVKRR